MHKLVMTSLLGLSIYLSAAANQGQNTEVFKQMYEQRKANGNKVLQSTPKKVIQSTSGKLTPFQQQVENKAQQLLEDKVVTDLQEAYKQAKQQVKQVVVKVKDGYRSGEYLQNALCHLSDDGIGCINDKNFSVRGFAERQAINAPIQGTASDIIKLAMIELNKLITTDDLDAKILLQVHDELIFEIDEANKESSIEIIKGVMENVHLNFKNFEVPLLVDYGFGNNWGDAH